MQRKAVGGAPHFTCTRQGQRGAVVGPVGQHLLLAVVNLVAMNLQDEVVLLEEPRSTKAGWGEVPSGAVGLLHERQQPKRLGGKKWIYKQSCSCTPKVSLF